MEQVLTESAQQESPPSADELARQFELAKLDYARLGTQEQSLMEKRSAIWPLFFTILIIPSGYAGIVSLRGAAYLLALVPFFVSCIALDIKHDEKVLRYDVRRAMKRLAAEWGFSNHDSKYSDEDTTRWWHGYYKVGKATAFVCAEILCSLIVSGYFYSTEQVVLSILLAVFNLIFILATSWCMI